MVLWSNDNEQWWQVQGTKLGTGVSGFDRYQFALDEHTVPSGDSTAWRNMRIHVIPFLKYFDGRRIFDHNRYPYDFENYTITKDETQYGDDPAICH